MIHAVGTREPRRKTRRPPQPIETRNRQRDAFAIPHGSPGRRSRPAGHESCRCARCSASTATSRCPPTPRPTSTCRPRPRLPVQPGGDAGDPRRLQAQPARDDPGLPRHRQIDAHRAGRRAPQLAVHPHQPRQPRQPHRPRRQGRDRAQGRHAGHRVPRGHPALLPAVQHRPRVSTSTTPAAPT